MTLSRARIIVVLLSVLSTGILIPFFIVAPTLKYPLKYSEAADVLKIIMPVFLGYIAAASSYVRYQLSEDRKESKELRAPIGLLSYLIYGPFLVFVVGMVSLLAAFGYTNSVYAPPGIGIAWEIFTGWISTILSIFTVTIGILLTVLFPSNDKQPTSNGATNNT